MIVGNTVPFGIYSTSSFPVGSCVSLTQKLEAGAVCQDVQNQWNTDYDYFTKTHPTQTQLYAGHRIYHQNITNLFSTRTQE